MRLHHFAALLILTLTLLLAGGSLIGLFDAPSPSPVANILHGLLGTRLRAWLGNDGLAAAIFAAGSTGSLISAFRLWRGFGNRPKQPKPRKIVEAQQEDPVLSADRMARLKRAGGIEADTIAPTETDRALAQAALDGMIAQVRHDADVESARGSEPVSIRLVPQVPIRDRDTPRSWVGGSPRLPASVDWPEIDGTPAQFLAQVCLADVPDGLWQGNGPREGWLALFVHPATCAPCVLHLLEDGPSRSAPCPMPVEAEWFQANRAVDGGDARRFGNQTLRQWPVDIVALEPGDAAPDASYQDLARALYADGFDVADPAFHPFDGPSMGAMIAILSEAAESQFGASLDDPYDFVPEHLSSTRASLGQLEASPPDDRDPDARQVQVDRLRNACAALEELSAALDAARPVNAAALQRVRAIVAQVTARLQSGALRADETARVMEAIRATSWVKINRCADPEGRPGAERIESRTLSLSRHDPDAPLWAHRWQRVHNALALDAHCAGTPALPAATEKICLPIWHDAALSGTPAMGHVPLGYVHRFDPATDATLFELPTNALVGWAWGDNDNLVITLPSAALARCDFAEPLMQVTN